MTIPAKREWPLLLFLLFWLGGWTAGGVTAIAILLAGAEDQEFLILWLCGWALGWAFAASALSWGFFGREIVVVASDAMTVTRKVFFWRREKRFARERIERLRIDIAPGLLKMMFALPSRDYFRHSLELWGLAGGSIVFDYGARTHRFGSKLDDAEARQLSSLLADELGIAAAP